MKIATYMIGGADFARLILAGYEMIDITVGSNPEHPLAPTWELVNGYRRGLLTEENYTVQYAELLLERWTEVDGFLGHIAGMDVALGCYCRPGDFCHRLLVADWMVDYYVVNYGQIVDWEIRK